MARTKDPKLEQERRDQIADAVIDLLRTASWKEVTLAAVARRAQVSKGVVTYWYNSKDALILAAIERHHARYLEQMSQMALTPTEPRQQLRELLRFALPDRATLQDELRLQAEVWSYAKGRPEVQARITQSYSVFRGATQALVQLGQVQGYVTSPRADRLHLYLHALLDGVSIHLAQDEGTDLEQVREDLLALIERWLQERLP